MSRLSRIHGISAVSRVLRINYYDLKRRVNSSPKVAPAQRTDRSAFVELNLAPSAGVECVVELEDRGAKMTLRMPAGSGADPSALIQAFWRR